ncbi:MAG: serine/threonine protein kinase [Deltaproteobacteria bacterium]|nr:serine/threonine protein kinase [Deltaproteobacteria bacterium]
MAHEPTHSLDEKTEVHGGPDARAASEDDNQGTQAASPRALADIAASNAGTAQADAKPSYGTHSARSIPTANEVLERSDIPRMRAFHIFGVFAPLGAIALSLLLGGDPHAQKLFWAGTVIISLSNVGLVYLSGSPDRWRPVPVGTLWMIATAGSLSVLYYFGPFSGAVIIQLLGIVFISLGRDRLTSIGVVAISFFGHLAIAGPIMLGWTTDVGVLSSAFAESSQLVIAEVLVLGFFISGYALGRWARHVNRTALDELAAAVRMIGDQQQVLAEVNDAQALARVRANEGRWTGQMMGPYRLGFVLGRGAMGEVYEAVTPDHKPAAVKLLNARSDGSTSLVERFHREMAVIARLDSPHVVKVFALSAPDAPVPYIAMERLHGDDLATRLRNEPRMPSDELVVMLDQVARGLEVARLANVVHRDLKPHNLFFHEGRTWKILDFGVSKVLDSEGTLTGEGIVGTPQYMAPEQAAGQHVTHLADVYALGAIAYRCLTGRSPFKGKDLAELVYQVVHVPPMRPSLLGRVPTAVEDVLAIAMAKDPRKRFPSAMSFAQAFIAARRGRLVPVDPPSSAWS